MLDTKDQRLQYLENKPPRYDKYVVFSRAMFQPRITRILLHSYLSLITQENHSNTNALEHRYTKTYILDFKGRVTVASVKNFQLVLHRKKVGLFGGDRTVERKTILQFGRIGADKFTMDFRYPMSPLQAFGIVLAAFEA